MLLTERIGHEVCSPNKPPIGMIYPQNTIHYIVKGKGYFNGVLLSEGDAFITKRNQYAEYYPDSSDSWEYYWVRFNDDGFDNFLTECNLSGCTYFHFDEFYRIKYFYDFFNSFNNPASNSLLCQSITELLRSIHTIKANNSEAVPCEIKAKKYIDNHFFQSDLNVKSVADKFHISRCYLRDIFVREFGISPREYLTEIRLERAKELLRASDFPISVIASSVGYNDLFQFSRFFTQHTGISPSEFRKSHKTTASPL